MPAATAALDAAYQIFAGRTDWWFQGRELLESLAIRINAHAGRSDAALERFRVAIERLEPMDVYAAAWLVADCAATLAERDPTVWDAVWTGGAHSGGILEVVGSGGFARATLGICLLLCRTFAVWIASRTASRVTGLPLAATRLTLSITTSAASYAVIV